MKKKSKISLLSLFVVFGFALTACNFVSDTEWPGFGVDHDGEIEIEPGPVEEPDDTKDTDTEPGPEIGGDGDDGGTDTPDESRPIYMHISTTALSIVLANPLDPDYESSRTLDLDSELTVEVYDQYHTVLSTEYTVSTTDSALLEINDHVIKAKESGTATLTITSVLTDTDDIPFTEDIIVTISDESYISTSISVDPSEVTVAWGESYTPNVTIEPSYVSQNWSAVHASGDMIFTLSGNGGMAFIHNGTGAGTETFNLYPADGSGVYCTLTLIVNTRYSEPESASASLERLSNTYEIGTIINDLRDYLDISYDHAGDNTYVQDRYSVSFESSNQDALTIDGYSAECVSTGNSTVTATITPENETSFSVTADISIIWTATELTLSETYLVLEEGDTATLSVTFGPDGYTDEPVVHWYSTDPTIASVEETGSSVIITAGNEDYGTCSITAYADGCEAVTCTVVVGARLVPVTPFADASWDEIAENAESGLARAAYDIGDTKDITLTTGEVITVRIIGFNHDEISGSDGGTAGLTLEMVDCLQTTYTLNGAYVTAYGRWDTSELRSELNESVFETLPNDLQACIKSVDKITNVRYDSEVFDTTSDKLFTLSIVEVFSTLGIYSIEDTSSDLYINRLAYCQEGSQYEFYHDEIGSCDPKKYDNEADCLVKTIPSDPSGDSQTGYWFRSPSIYSQYYPWRFGYSEEHGYCSYNDGAPNVSRGVSFAFCI